MSELSEEKSAVVDPLRRSNNAEEKAAIVNILQDSWVLKRSKSSEEKRQALSVIGSGSVGNDD